jgi:colicin import membrane protein
VAAAPTLLRARYLEDELPPEEESAEQRLARERALRTRDRAAKARMAAATAAMAATASVQDDDAELLRTLQPSDSQAVVQLSSMRKQQQDALHAVLVLAEEAAAAAAAEAAAAAVAEAVEAEAEAEAEAAAGKEGGKGRSNEDGAQGAAAATTDRRRWAEEAAAVAAEVAEVAAAQRAAVAKAGPRTEGAEEAEGAALCGWVRGKDREPSEMAQQLWEEDGWAVWEQALGVAVINDRNYCVDKVDGEVVRRAV